MWSIKCCVYAYDTNKGMKKKKKNMMGSVFREVSEDGPTSTGPTQKWDYYYYLNKKYNIIDIK